MMQVRVMTEADIPLGMRLKTQAGWNQTEADWRRFLRMQPDGCFVGRWDGQDVATTTTCIFGSIGWIAMVLVDAEYRHRGIGTRLVQHALEFLDARRIPIVRLDATALGRPVYERLGFVAEYELMRMEGMATSAGGEFQRCETAGTEHLDTIVRWDFAATGTPREKLLSRLLAEDASRGYLIGSPNQPGGFVLARPGSRAAHLGPAVALSPGTGRALLDRAAADWTGQRIYIDVPSDNPHAVRWAEDRGLTCQRAFTRMVRGVPLQDNTNQLWASSGPEKG
jgi:GNAT superfamily N-acetyltransferase